MEKERVTNEKAIALYHVVYKHEDFEDAATKLFDLVRDAARRHPGKLRHLYLDVEGHRNKQDGFDHDMFELQTNFMLKVLCPYFSEIHMPLGGHIKNPKPQRDDVPEALEITPGT